MDDPHDKISLVVPADLAANGAATLECATSAGANVGHIRITAIRGGA